ncbi:MAG: right-handed parallel beta-helix repeat-containing protein [Planctomycetes bacterium]|nr:right-handed parallel beta-helix repeat-containing protein [Planctomycetota bacterium]
MAAGSLTLALFTFVQQPGPVAVPVRRVTANLTLSGGSLRESLLVEADGITIDGGGAELVGPGETGSPETFQGVGLAAEGRSRVEVRNLKIRGFRNAIVVRGGLGWKIEDCDLSGNHHDPGFGWGDGDHTGGILFERVTDSIVRRTKATQNWNACELRRSDRNQFLHCDFSHASNTCFKLETSSENRVLDCNLSYGLRIAPGEVHARDSTGVLIESGSNDNVFERNDVTHGGDGVFIRVLNGWISTGNRFEDNDCSYANNNGFESWSPGNVFLRNRANHCSYGFWLGGSDRSVVEGNEAAFNGDPRGFHNAPEPDFGHGGIVIVHGTGTHSRIEGNDCHDNFGGGIVLRGDLSTRGGAWKLHHVLVQRNRLSRNRVGIFVMFADAIHLIANELSENNRDEQIEDVTSLERETRRPIEGPAPRLLIEGPAVVRSGDVATYAARAASERKGRQLAVHWVLSGRDWRPASYRSEGVVFELPVLAPGIYRLGAMVSDGELRNLTGLAVRVLSAAPELATEDPARWSAGAASVRSAEPLVGSRSVSFTQETAAEPLEVSLSAANLDLSKARALSFWLAVESEATFGLAAPAPVVELRAGKGRRTYSPTRGGAPANALLDPAVPEARGSWAFVRVPLNGGADWSVQESIEGTAPTRYDGGLEITTRSADLHTSERGAMFALAGKLHLLGAGGSAILTSEDGSAWTTLTPPFEDLGCEPDPSAGFLASSEERGEAGTLILRARDRGPGKAARLLLFDRKKGQWSRLETAVSVATSGIVHRGSLFGIAPARLANFGGALCRISLEGAELVESRTMLSGLLGADPHWIGHNSPLTALGDQLYGIKNDWVSPQPEIPGDRLFRIDPQRFVRSELRQPPSQFDVPGAWIARETAATDLGPLPFETGRGASLVSLPPHWTSAIGREGGLFLIAGCSPSNQDGLGMPSSRAALWDKASGRWTMLDLPGDTGAGTAAALLGNSIYVKRAGGSSPGSNRDLWVIRPMPPAEYEAAKASQAAARFDASRIDHIIFQFRSSAPSPLRVRIDGLTVE